MAFIVLDALGSGKGLWVRVRGHLSPIPWDSPHVDPAQRKDRAAEVRYLPLLPSHGDSAGPGAPCGHWFSARPLRGHPLLSPPTPRGQGAHIPTVLNSMR